MDNTKIRDEDLESVSGGAPGIEDLCNLIGDIVEISSFDSQGHPTHWISNTGIHKGKSWHYECPVCGKVMKLAAMDSLYCDYCKLNYISDTEKYAVFDQ
ncbi:MAG: hypothetical protein Q4C42_11085 [Clostridia bacterium]|nr:hypothetical protein [Clostridia bacterium]